MFWFSVHFKNFIFFLENLYCSRWQLSGAKPTLFLNVKLFIQLGKHSQYAPEDCQITFFSRFLTIFEHKKISLLYKQVRQNFGKFHLNIFWIFYCHLRCP